MLWILQAWYAYKIKTMRYLLILLSLVSLCNAGTIDPQAKDSEHLAYGNKHGCVLRIVGKVKDTENAFLKGSCVVIDKYWALTAAHVVYNSTNEAILYKDEAYPAKEVIIHEKFKYKPTDCYDIALVRLSKPLVLDFYPELYTKQDEKGKICSIAGYGATGTFRTGYISGSGDYKKRAGSNIVDDIIDNNLVCSVHKGARTTLEFLIAPGDSGGGLFIDKKLAGISSCVMATDGKSDSDYGDEAIFTSIGVNYKWIAKNIDK